MFFSAKYKGFTLVLNQPNETSLKVYAGDEEYMTIALHREDDLVRAIAVAKEMIDEFTSK